ncbi:hypothetical protein JKP88DRAFT_351061 [Tribonema minus]|uniref:DUF6816 domain-containing protein n=1 Tax=Tribonema minus TaxID=303371 RepID=A0A835YLH6_9STRA|nr:hypothetical protein JKP88DRAFT_351061 [Tribonema minus]
MATLIAAAPPTLASLEVDCFSLESLPQPLQLPLRLRELTLRQCLDNVNESTSRPIGDTILPSSLDTLTLEDYKIGPHLQLPRDLRTLCLENCILSWRESSGGRGSNEGNGGRVNQFPVFPDSLITLELESLYSADHDFQHPVLTLPPNIQQVSITCERSDQPELAFNGPLGPLPPSLRTLVIEHPDGCAALPPLPLGLRELTLSEYEHKLQAPLPPSLEALELQGWGKQQSLCDALATFGGGNFQRLTLAGRSQRGGLRSSIGPLPATLTHFTCWLGGGEGEEEDEQDEDNSSDAQLPPLPLGLQELCVNGIALPAALPASLRVVLLGMDVDMSALQEPLEMPGRHVEVGYEYYVTDFWEQQWCRQRRRLSWYMEAAKALTVAYCGSEGGRGAKDRRNARRGPIAALSSGLKLADVFYPTYFKGAWNCKSVTQEVQAPAGPELFGGESALEKAMADVGSELIYKTRFRVLGPEVVVADRVFNVEAVTKAAMGQFAVLNTEQIDGDPNHVVFYISPSGASGTVFRADLRVLQRRQEEWTDDQGRCARQECFAAMELTRQTECFAAMELTRQTVTGNTRAPPLVKDIETTTLYTRTAEDRLEGMQVTNTFLVPPVLPRYLAPAAAGGADAAAALSDGERALLAWAAEQRARHERAGGVAVDRRAYYVTYARGAAGGGKGEGGQEVFGSATIGRSARRTDVRGVVLLPRHFSSNCAGLSAATAALLLLLLRLSVWPKLSRLHVVAHCRGMGVRGRDAMSYT